MNFLFYDIIFLVLFLVGTALFLYKNRKNVEVESKIVFLYKTQMGLDTIDKIGKRYPRFLNFLSDIVIVFGYIMMALSIFFLVYLVKLMFDSAVVPRIAPIIPLIPYMPELFKLDFLPPFYFTYWIIVIAIIAIGHEFAHGIFARLNDVKLKSTGFGFIGPLLAAFVEVDEGQMAKKPIKSQLSILAAGSFANLVMAFFFLLMMNGFFMATYHPQGVVFNMYAINPVNISEIYGINGLPVNNLYEDYGKLRMDNITQFEFMVDNKSYFGDSGIVDLQLINNNVSQLVLYDGSPAYNANLSGIIQKISSEDREYEINVIDDIGESLSEFKPGDEITVETTTGNYTLILGSDSTNSSKAYLGIAYMKLNQRLVGKVISFFMVKDPFTYYEPKWDGTNGNLIIFIYNLFYWIVLVNFSVMMVNMLPFSIFDGGRFFYLSALSITKRKKKALLIFKIMNWIMILILVAMMWVWFVRAF
ncbi:MAG: site-2 protease family protein [Nanoarchaeota archaeon]|nr:site-2 protease family protein [Nanoarchaeota archaeon]